MFEHTRVQDQEHGRVVRVVPGTGQSAADCCHDSVRRVPNTHVLPLRLCAATWRSNRPIIHSAPRVPGTWKLDQPKARFRDTSLCRHP